MHERMERQWRAAQAIRASLIADLERRFGGGVEEFVDEAIVRCATAPAIRSDAHARAWTARTARALAVDAWRHQRAASRQAARLTAGPGPSAEDLVLDRELLREAAAAVAALPPDQQAILTAVADGVPLSRIAAEHGRSLFATKHLLQRARTTVRARLAEIHSACVLVAVRCRARGWNRSSPQFMARVAELSLVLPVLLLVAGPALTSLHGARAGARQEPPESGTVWREHRDAPGPSEPGGPGGPRELVEAHGDAVAPPPAGARPEHVDLGPVRVGQRVAEYPEQVHVPAPENLGEKLADIRTCLGYGVDVGPELVSCRPGEPGPEPWLHVPGARLDPTAS